MSNNNQALPLSVSSWQKKSSRIVYQNQWLSLREDQVIRPDGKPGIYSVIDKPSPSVQIVAIDEQQQILCITIERYPLGINSIEIPAGAADADPVLKAAQRELKEETGFTAELWEDVGKYSAIPGIMSTWCYVFIARNLKPGSENQQAEEGIKNCQFYSYKHILQLIKEGKMHDGQGIAALMKASIHLNLV